MPVALRCSSTNPEHGDRIFFLPATGNSPGKERAIRQQMKKIADHLA
ncbi:hypothetical protein ACVXHB_17770 [Escherichia coli]